MRLPKENKSSTIQGYCVSEDEMKAENERAFIKSCIVCMGIEELCDLLDELDISRDVKNELEYREELECREDN